MRISVENLSMSPRTLLLLLLLLLLQRWHTSWHLSAPG
jgi:hypothetical protein